MNTQMEQIKIANLYSPTMFHERRFRQSLLWLSLGAILCHPFPSLAQADTKTLQQLVAQKAIDEWISFNAPNQPIVKTSADVSQLAKSHLEYRKCLRINQFWAAVPDTDNKPPGGDTCTFNIPPTPQGKGQAKKWDAFPWSAAFVSFIMQESGLGKDFKLSGRHAKYIVDSVKNRDTANHPFRGYRITEIKPEIGDLVCAPRDEDKSLTYDQIKEKRDFKSHCDIVVAKKSNSTIEVIGGNVGDTVAKTIVDLNSEGYIDNSDKSFRNWFVVIRNGARS